MNLAGLVILYNPDEHLLKRIQSYKPNIKKLFIADNSRVSHQELLKSLLLENEVYYIHDGKNEGIAKRINQAANLALNDGFNWLLTMDQDSYFEENIFTNYLDCIAQYEEKANVAVFGLEYDPKCLTKNACDPYITSKVITSGSIVNLSLFEKVGGYDENLFIDLVDFEYCFRAVIKGYQIIQYRNIFLRHSLGKTSVHRSLKNFKQSIRSLHSPLRMYYMTRNFFYVRSKYKNLLKEETKANRKALLYHVKNNLLYNAKRFSVIRFMLLGIFDFARNKMGSFNYKNEK